MTKIWWVRHGPTHAKGMVGWADLPADLSDTAALARLSDHLPVDGIVISSDLQRCVKTADAIAGDRTRLPHDPDLREINFGLWDGKTGAEIAKAYPDLSRDYWTSPGDVAAPEGESWNQCAARVSRAVDRLITDHNGAGLIIVAHLGVILTQLQRAANMSGSSAIAFKVDNLSVTTLEYLGNAWRILGVNHTL